MSPGHWTILGILGTLALCIGVLVKRALAPVALGLLVVTSVQAQPQGTGGGGVATTVSVSGPVSATQSGTWLMQPGNVANTTPWLYSLSQGGNTATVSAGGALKVDGSAVTQPVSGTFWQATQPVSGTFFQATQPISAVSLPLPTNAATDRATAAAPGAVRLSDGAAFYDGTKTGQLPSALVGGRVDVNTGAWLGSTAPTVGQKTMANALPVSIASDQSTVTVGGTVAVSTALLLDATFTGRINTQGQKTMAASTPVVISSDQSALAVTGPLTDAQLRASAVPISAASLPLPTGASTETTLASVLTAVNRIPTSPATDRPAVDASGTARAPQVTTNGTALVIVTGASPSLLPKCNPVRRTACQ